MSHILIVDDDPQVRRMLCRIMEMQKLDFEAVGTVSEARAVITERMPAVVLLDVVVGSESGLTLHADLRRSDPVVPAVVFITGRRDIFPEIATVAGPADDWIIKPWDPAELVARVRLILRRQESPNPTTSEQHSANRHA